MFHTLTLDNQGQVHQKNLGKLNFFKKTQNKIEIITKFTEIHLYFLTQPRPFTNDIHGDHLSWNIVNLENFKEKINMDYIKVCNFLEKS